MADEQTQPTQGNEPAARTETGEIKDQQGTQPVTTPETKPAAETKPSTETKAETKPETKPETKAEPGKVPDKYELKAPEGYEVDPKLVEEATPIFKKLGLDQAAAQELTDLWNKHSIESAEAPYKAYETMRTGWRDEAAKAADLGNGKDNLKPEVLANIKSAIDAIGDPKAITEFKNAMDLTGVGDNPAFIRAFNKLGSLLAEGTLVRAGAPSKEGQTAPGSKPPTAARALFPNLPSSANP